MCILRLRCIQSPARPWRRSRQSLPWLFSGSAQHLESGIVELTSDAEYEAAMQDVADKDARAVVDFTATWCGPCERTGTPGHHGRCHVHGTNSEWSACYAWRALQRANSPK